MSEADSEALRRLLRVVEGFMRDVDFLGPLCPLWARERARQFENITKDMKE